MRMNVLNVAVEPDLVDEEPFLKEGKRFTDIRKRWRWTWILYAALVVIIILILKVSISVVTWLKGHYSSPAVGRVDNTQAYGEVQVAIDSVQFLGLQTSENACSRRDLGFTGQLGDYWYAIHGDALWCAGGFEDPNDPDIEYGGMVRNTISLMTDNVLKPLDLYLDSEGPVAHPLQFFPFYPSWGEHMLTGFGGTSICAVNDTTGIVYYLVNDPINGPIGAGVAKIELIDGYVPNVTERLGEKGMWWDTDHHPRYGDVAAYLDDNSDYIYALGGAPSSATEYIGQGYVYQARVHKKDAFDLSQYEYWYGREDKWRQKRLNKFNSETAIMWNVGQGQIVWNSHYKCYIFVHTEPGSNRVVLKTASSPEGPWSEDLLVYETEVVDGGQIYAGVTHPYLDDSGKTLTVTYTNHPNNIEAIKVTFK